MQFTLKGESSKPGELLSQDTFYVGNLKGRGKVYLHTVVDTFGSYAFGVLGTSKRPGLTKQVSSRAVSVLHNDVRRNELSAVLPFYEAEEIPVEKILTDNGRELCGREYERPFELFPALNDIKHKRTKARSTRSVCTFEGGSERNDGEPGATSGSGKRPDSGDL